MFRCLCTLVICWYFLNRNGEYVHANDDVERFDDIIVPPGDNRQSRGLKLKNGIRVLLIHDPLAEKSAASVAFGTGSLNDPEKQPGLVNLIGYMLMKTGTNHSRKFENFVESHRGKLEAPFTTDEVQSFNFDIESSHFVQAFNRFARFFHQTQICTEIKPVTLVKSLHAVELEYRERKRVDNFRISQVERSISKMSHPYNHLTSGNMSVISPHLTVYRLSETLIIPDTAVPLLRADIQTFYSAWYSSNIMTMAVIGKENLDELENMVVSSFQEVRCSDPPARKKTFSFEDHPWGAEQLRNKVYIVPTGEELQYVSLIFPIPDYSQDPDLYMAGADNYVDYCITHPGRGTLSSVLQNLGLCNEVLFQYDTIAGIAFAGVGCKVTDAGLEQIDTIIDLIFQYIHMLNEGDPREWISNEIRISSEKAFLYGKSDHNIALEYVRSISTLLQHDKFPMKNTLVRGYFRDNWKPEVVKHFLSYLQPENMK